MSLNVLIVDDSSVMRKVVQKSLTMSRIPLGNVYEACNGQEGLEKLKDSWIDLALVDINMPVMTGVEMIEHVRKDVELSSLKIIIVSSDNSVGRQQMMQNQVSGFVGKPFSPEIMRKTILQSIGVIDDYSNGEQTFQSCGPDF